MQARKKDLQLTMLNQFKQSMAGPDWEIDDYEWYGTLMLPSTACCRAEFPAARMIPGSISI